MKIAVAGTGYVGLSNALLLSQHNDVWAVDILQSKIDLINSALFGHTAASGTNRPQQSIAFR